MDGHDFLRMYSRRKVDCTEIGSNSITLDLIYHSVDYRLFAVINIFMILLINVCDKFTVIKQTDSLEKSPSSEADSLPADREILPFYGTKRFVTMSTKAHR
jgi:hypothetical protein